MNAEAFATLLQARRSGAGHWLAKCPAHTDHNPSLSIAAGRDGRTLVLCRTGCATADVLKAVGLTSRDLFVSNGLTPAQRSHAAKVNGEADEERARQHVIYRAQRDRVYKLEHLVDVIGGRLARRSHDLELGKLFHLACDMLHHAQTGACPGHEDGP